MAQLIQLKRRAAIGKPDILLAGEPLYNVAENAFYIGTGSAVVRFDAGAFYGDCSTAAATAAKVVACPGIVLLKGVEVTVKFKVTNTVAPASLTLNVGGTGAKAIKYRGADLPSADVLSANRTYKFSYNGTEWELIGDLDTDTTVGAALSSHTDNSTIHITGAERTKWDGVVTDFGNLEIGGRNLVSNLQINWEQGWIVSYSGAEMATPIRIRTKGYIPVTENTNYILSTKRTITTTVKGAVWFYDVNDVWLSDGKTDFYDNTYNVGDTCYAKGISPAGAVKARIAIMEDATPITLSELGNTLFVKLEKGNKPTDWSPAPEDQVSDWNTTDVASFSYIKNKPTQLSQFTDNIGVATHIANTANPHAVTTAQIGAVDLTTNQTIGGVKTFTGNITAPTAKLTNLTDGYLPYHVSDASGLANSPIYTDGTNVGIGTTSPQSLLHIKASDGVTGVINIEGGKIGVTSIGEVNSRLDFGTPDGSVIGAIGGSIQSITESTNGAYVGMGLFTYKQSDGELSEKVRITSGGNVGIGTTTPFQKLSVIGNINIDGSSAYLYDGAQALKLAKGADTFYANTFVGHNAGNPSAYRQTALGYAAGYSNSGSSQTALGFYAGRENTGSSQTALGFYAGRSNTGDHQTALGYAAGYSNSGSSQTALGFYAGRENTGSAQTALGTYAGNANSESYQTAVGYYAGYSNSGSSQTALGFYAGRSNTGDRVIGIGYEATRDNTASDVVAIGYQAGKNNTVANQFIVKQANLNAVPLIQGDFSSGNVTIAGTIQATTAKLTNLTDGYLPYHVSDASGLANSPIITNGTNIGIGTTNPGKLLQVGDNLSPWTNVEGIIRLAGKNTGGGTRTWDVGTEAIINPYKFFIKDVNADAIRMVIDITGNVGIGYTDPGTYKLKVNGTGYFNSNLTVGGTLGVTGNTTLSGTLGVTGASTLSTATITSKLNFGSSSSDKWINLNGSAKLYDVTAFNLSIKHLTPFIDFYYGNGSTVTARIIEQDTGVLDIIGSVKIPDSKYLQIGSARLTYETVGGVGFLKLAHSEGTTPMHLVTTGGQTMLYSEGVPASGDDGGSGTLVYLNGSSVASETAYIYAPTTAGSSTNILKSNGSGEPSWVDITSLIPWGSSGISTMVSRSDHSHSGVYAAASHSHSGYAALSHNHTTLTNFEGITYVDSNSDQQNMLIRTGTNDDDILLGNADHNLTIRGDNVKIETGVSPVAGFWKSDNNGNLSVDTNTYLTGITKAMVDAVSCNADTVDSLHAASFLRSDAANSSDIAWGSTSGLGIRFWNDEKYKIFMAETTNTTYGNRMSGDISSDYNMYFRIDGGNNGFVFESSYSVKLASINPDGFRTTLPFIIRSTNTSYDDSQLLLGGATFNYDAASALVELNKGIKFSAGVIEGAVLSNYGVCSTAASTGAKTVTISGFRLATGVQINVKFSNNNYAYPITLNVSSTGAKTVKAYGDNDEQYFLEQIQAGAVVPFVYDGTYWVIPTTPSMY